jgi:hypothetical protein
MGSHPLNLVFRFLLELSALIVAGYWGWQLSDGWHKYLLALGIPMVLAAIWGTFAVPGDPSRSGAAPVVTPGLVRLFIELGIFAFATWALSDLDYKRSFLIFGMLVLIHYALSFDRILWLLKR